MRISTPAVALGLLFAIAAHVVASDDTDNDVLLGIIRSYRDAVSPGVNAQYRVQTWASDTDRCSATWRCDNVIKGRFHRFSWRLVAQSPDIAAHGQQDATIGAFTDCATSFTPQRLEWLTRHDGTMLVYAFNEAERATLQANASPSDFYRLTATYTKGIDPLQVAPVMQPVAFLNGNGPGGIISRSGWNLLYDESRLQQIVAGFALTQRSAQSLTFTAIQSDADFWKLFSVDATFAKTHTPAEVEVAKQKMLRDWGGNFTSVRLDRVGDAWRIAKIEAGQRSVIGQAIDINYTDRIIPQTCIVQRFERDKAYEAIRFELVECSKMVTDADLPIDPSEARTIRDDITGMTIETTP